MERTRVYRMGRLLLLMLAVACLALNGTAYVLLRQEWLLGRVRQTLRQGLAQQYGLEISFVKLKPGPGLGLEVTGLAVKDGWQRDKPLVARSAHVYARLSVFRLLSHLKHPEAALTEILVDRPEFICARGDDGSWIWQRFLQAPSGRNYFRPSIRLHQVKLCFHDSPFPHPTGQLTIPDAVLDLAAYPRLRGWSTVATDLDPSLLVRATAEYDLDRAAGRASLSWEGATPARWQTAGWFPDDQVRFVRGNLRGEAQIELGTPLGLRQATASLAGGLLEIRQPGWPRLALNGRLELKDRELRFSGLSLRAGRSAISGNMRLLLDGRDPPIRGNLNLARLDLAMVSRLLSIPGPVDLKGSVRGSLAVSGQLRQPVFRGDLAMTDGELSYPPLPPVRNVRIEGEFSAQDFVVNSFRAEVGQAKIAGRGRLRLLPSVRLEMKLHADHVAAGEFLGALGQPGWEGEGQADGDLIATSSRWGIKSSLNWRGLSWRGRALPNGQARIALDASASVLGVRAEGQAGSGRFEVDGCQNKGDWRGTARLDQVVLAPLASFLPPGFQDLDGVATADLAWHGSLAAPEVIFAGKVRQLRLAGRKLDEFQASFSWRDTGIEVETAQIRLGDASASLHGRVDWRRGDLAFSLAAHRLPLALLQADVTGRVEGRLELAGQWPAGLTGKGWAHLSGLSWQGVPLGVAEIDLAVARDQVTIGRGRLESADGHLDFSGRVPLTSQGELAVSIADLDWATSAWEKLLPGLAGLEGRLTGSGRVAGTLTAPLVSAQVELGPGQIHDLEWQSATASLRWQQDRLMVERGRISAAGMDVAVNGSVGSSGWDMTVQSAGADLASIAAALPYELPWSIGRLSGELTIGGRIGGPLNHPHVDGTVKVTQPVVGQFACERLTARIELDGQMLTLTSLEAWAAERKYVAAGRIDLARQAVEMELQVTHGDLAALLGLAAIKTPWPVRGVVTGQAKLAGNLKNPMFQTTLYVEEGTAGQFPFAAEAELAYDGRILSCDKLRLAYDGGMLTATGKLAAAESRLDLEAQNLPLAELARLAGWGEKIVGRGNLRLALARTGRSTRGDFRVEVGPGASVAQIPLNRVLVAGTIEDRNIVLSQAELISGGHGLLAAGHFPLPKDLGALEALFDGVPGSQDQLGLTIEATGLPVALFNPALGGTATFTGGQINVSARLAGTWASPAMEGVVRLVEAGGTMSLLPDPMVGLNAEARLEGQRIQITKASARIGPGWVELGGSVRIAKGVPRYDLKLSARRIAFKSPGLFDGQAATMNLAISGGPMPLVEGEIVVQDSRVTIGLSSPGTPPPPIRLNLNLTVGKDVRFFQPGVADIPITGELQLRGTPIAPTLAGVVSASRGTFLVYGEHFDLTSAIATFSHDRGYLPYVELQGNKVIRGTKVFARVRGEIDETGPTISLWSDPPLSQQQILDLLRWTAPSGSGTGSAATGRFLIGGLEFVVETVFGRISEDFRRLIDADQLHLSLDDQSGAFSIQMGKFVLDDFYVSYQIQFDEFSTQVWSFDYHLNPSLSLGGIFSTTDSPQWTLAYQFRF